MKIRVEEYIRPDGSSPYRDWFDGLDAQMAAKVTTAKLRMELGISSKVKWFAGIGEYVIDWGPGYRIYLAKDGASLIVLFAVAPSAVSRRTSNGPRRCTPNTRNEKGKDHGTYTRFQENHRRSSRARPGVCQSASG
jgi:putative addiction module killer protein